MDFIANYLSGEQATDLLVAVGALALFLALAAVLRGWLGRRLASWRARRGVNVDPDILAALLRSVYWVLNFMAADLFLDFLDLSPGAERWAGYFFLVIFTWLSISLAFNLIRFTLDVSLRRRGSSLAEHRGRVVLPVVKGVIWVIALAFLLDNFGVEITTILAGLGVAGVAVGFAAQAILGDLFSYFAILFDRPFRIGDFVVLDASFRGHIEHIGLKTSRLRSLDGEQIVLSNTDLTNSRVKNYRRMVRRRVLFSFGVLYSTPPDTLERIAGWVREIIDSMELATYERVHFVRFGESSLEFEVVYYVESPEYNDWMDVQQAMNLAIMRRLAEAGVEFAFPTRTLHLYSEPQEEGEEKGDA